VQSLTESYLYTVEALQEYLAHLTPNGYLCITRWLKVPPRDALKLFATALLALEKRGVADPAKRLLLIRGWNTSTLLIKNGEISPQDIEATRKFTEQRSFDLAYYAGITPQETNRFNRLEEAFLYDGATALAGPGRAGFLERYKFDLRPTWDDRPYFFDFFKWRSLSEFHSAAALAPGRIACPPGGPGTSLRLLLRPGTRVPVPRNRIHPTLHRLSESSALYDCRRHLLLPRIRRIGQRTRAETRGKVGQGWVGQRIAS
jgi:hypothetical protein